MLRRLPVTSSLIHKSTKTPFLSVGFFLNFNSPSLSPLLLSSTQHIHERLPRVRNYLADEKMDAAKSALIQLNLMVSQGIEPDVHMYTSLILIMGRAQLEWQAFKLFSRMLEQGVKPLPETYLALKRATNPKRKKMIEKIEAKMAEMNDLLPEQLANSVLHSREKSQRAADRQMKELLNPTKVERLGENDTTEAENNNQQQSERNKDEEEDNLEDHYRSSNPEVQLKKSRERQDRQEKIAELWNEGKDVPTMKIDSLESVMATIGSIDARRAHQESLASGKQRTKLRDQLLNKMHEEELRIMLSIHRQSRHGSKEQLVNRVLTQVPADYLEATLDRRSHYFDSVKKVLELQIDELKTLQEQQEGAQKNNNKNNNDENNNEEEEPDEMMKELLQSIDIRSKIKNQLTSSSQQNDGHLVDTHNNQENSSSSRGTEEEGIQPKDASELTPQEKYNLSPSHLETPWGLLRKPFRPPPNPSPPDPERDEKQKLNQQELVELQNSLIDGTLDQMPQRTLRRYCRHFHLKWSRKSGSAALQDIVEWHLRTFKPKIDDAGNDVLAPTASRDQQLERDHELDAYDAAEEERRSQQQTLDQYNALLAVARVTDNMKLVDDAKVSKTVYDRQQLDRLDRKRTLQAVESQKWKQRMSDLDANMRKMPPGYRQKSPSEAEEDPRAQDLLTRTGEKASSRILGIEDLAKEKQDLLNETLIASSLDREAHQSSSSLNRTTFFDDDNYTNEQKYGHQTQTDASQQQQQTPSREQLLRAQELPPWETSASSSASSSHAPFNLRTGRFDVGVPQTEIYEDSTGRYKLRRPQALKNRFKIDESLLPAPQQERIQRERTMQQEEENLDEQDRELKRGKYSKTAQRLQTLNQRVKDRRKRERELKNEVQPLPPPRRMSQRLKWNAPKEVITKNARKRQNDDGERDE